MDLGKLKWPILFLLLLAIFWFFTPSAANYFYNKHTQVEPGSDPALDKKHEAGLTFHGNFQMKTLRLKRAIQFLQAAVDRYPNGRNYWLNMSRLARCHERLGNYETTIEILETMLANNAKSIDDRVPPNSHLETRINKLREVHEIAPGRKW
ncbi:MAG TPA: tetratricopeptide repeat protein [Candidatus Hydrogenedentes bacterium]|nr:tetratricopeptide repeat protein [Candidatus Hydrogenedentota bacterium]HIJ74754.1 tetratricopeptide repeat protein [Candidatus Hydrogenedentota bacterium]